MKQKFKKTTGLLMALIMLLGVIGAAPFSAITETYLTYDEQGYFSFNPSTGELRLTSGRFNGDSFKNNDVWDVDKSEIKSVYARKNVKFEADCTSMFKDFVNCTSIDLSNVNTNEVINMEQMFYNCRSLTSVNLSGLKTPTLGTMKKCFIIVQV